MSTHSAGRDVVTDTDKKITVGNTVKPRHDKVMPVGQRAASPLTVRGYVVQCLFQDENKWLCNLAGVNGAYDTSDFVCAE
ncbi:MAG: hypothetical protein A2928_04000 [Candidatus Taylorbacteria bacterium RIFCSPLOWO2_01_FULL_45_15b]|uniref:Uncharacterized protein n=1 Tax=Candidatus Taylorbacteria bacterium RIFCSPLOWO2_01_FULL_45_15b TaxID=1802319 RepID=A0A1G2NG52_9BACT|nr:MAG: hypothetical protein A2928_04000 [Candidatus Taylorbacteria bacterium RIFCSPLOWO2_01_FULL_45_15b]